jgi:hypothetical protein
MVNFPEGGHIMATIPAGGTSLWILFLQVGQNYGQHLCRWDKVISNSQAGGTRLWSSILNVGQGYGQFNCRLQLGQGYGQHSYRVMTYISEGRRGLWTTFLQGEIGYNHYGHHSCRVGDGYDEHPGSMREGYDNIPAGRRGLWTTSCRAKNRV